jgi:hypothetical protein
MAFGPVGPTNPFPIELAQSERMVPFVYSIILHLCGRCAPVVVVVVVVGALALDFVGVVESCIVV